MVKARLCSGSDWYFQDYSPNPGAPQGHHAGMALTSLEAEEAEEGGMIREDAAVEEVGRSEAREE